MPNYYTDNGLFEAGPTSGAFPAFSSLQTLTLNSDANNLWRPTAGIGYSIVITSNVGITGIVAPATQTEFWLFNATSNNTLRLRHQDNASSAANRFKLPNDGTYQLRANASVRVVYNTLQSRWFIVGADR